MTFEFEISPNAISAMATTGALVVLLVLVMLIWSAYITMLNKLQAFYRESPGMALAFVLLIAWILSPLYYPVYGVIWLLTYPITRGKL